MRGQKYNDDIKEQAFALLAVNNSVSFVAKKLGIPRSTIKSWKEAYDKGAEEREELSIAKLRHKNKEQFVQNAWGLIGKVETLLERRLERAISNEDVIDRMLDEIVKLEGEGMSEVQTRSICAKLSSLKLESVRELATILGTLYDKQALANREATSIVDGDVALRFEDL